MTDFIANKYYVLEQPKLLAEAHIHVDQQNKILDSFQKYKVEHNADFIQVRNSISRGICFTGLCYLEANADKIDMTKFKVSKAFPAQDQEGNMVCVIRAIARAKYKEGMRIESIRYSYNNFCKLLVAQGHLVSMAASADGSPIYFEVKGIAVDAAREITGSEYEAYYNECSKEEVVE